MINPIDNINSILSLSKFHTISVAPKKHIQNKDLHRQIAINSIRTAATKILDAGKLDIDIIDADKLYPNKKMATDFCEVKSTMYILSQYEVDEIRKQLELINNVCNK